MLNLLKGISRISKKALVLQIPAGCHSHFHSFYTFSISSSRLYFGVTSNLSTLGRVRGTDSVPGNFLKWSAVGFSRGSKFATGFTPLQRKPLESIIDIERAKFQSPEDLISVWDDMPHLLFTGLEDYKERGTQASPYFAVTHYTEFAETKGIVLIRGDVVLPSKLSDSEARWLLETAQTFYLNDARYKLVERFNKETREFEFNDVLRALEMPVL